MFNIMRADLYKLRKSKLLLWITLGLLGILILGNFLTLKGKGTMTLLSDLEKLNTIHFAIKGSAIIGQLLKGSNILVFFMVPIVLSSFISDFNFGTIKNVVPYHYSRTTIYCAKLVISSIVACLLPIIFALAGFLVNQLFNGFSGPVKGQDFIDLFRIVLFQLPLIFGFIATMTLVGVIFQRSVAIVSVTFIYVLGTSLLDQIVKITNFSLYEPITNLDRAAYLNQLSQLQVTRIIGVGIAITIISAGLGCFIFNRKNIK